MGLLLRIGVLSLWEEGGEFSMAATESAGAGPPATPKPVEAEKGEKQEEKVEEEKEKEEEEEEVKGGELLFCGCASWENVGRKTVDGSNNTNMSKPVRLTSLLNVSIAFIASGSGTPQFFLLYGVCFFILP